MAYLNHWWNMSNGPDPTCPTCHGRHVDVLTRQLSPCPNCNGRGRSASPHVAEAESYNPGFGLYRLLSGVASELKPKSYLEIGTNVGASLLTVLRAHPGVERICCCDTWGADKGGWGKGGHSHIDGMLLELGWYGVATYLDGKSQKLIPHLNDTFDLILVDGDHESEPAMRDLENCWPLLNAGGVVVVDDTANYAFNLAWVVSTFASKHTDAEITSIESAPTGATAITKRA